MADCAVIGINCDPWCHPTATVTGIRHWLAWAADGRLIPGPAESTSPDHADCGKLAAAAIVGADLAIPDNATAEQIAAAINAHGGGWSAAVGYAPIAALIPGAAAATVYNCWRADLESDDLASSHNPGMGTVLVSRPAQPQPGAVSATGDDMPAMIFDTPADGICAWNGAAYVHCATPADVEAMVRGGAVQCGAITQAQHDALVAACGGGATALLAALGAKLDQLAAAVGKVDGDVQAGDAIATEMDATIDRAFPAADHQGGPA